MKSGNEVKIKSFLGKDKPDETIEDEYNYWKLIGEKGVIIDKRKKHPYYCDRGEQVLVKFEKSLSDIGVEAHNSINNSLWFFLDDVEEI